MGRLILPTSGVIYVDAQIAIYSTDNHPVYAPLCAPVWQVGGEVSVISSQLILLETLVGPLRHKNFLLAAAREALWYQPNTFLVPITEEVLREAARLRALVPSFKTPDAIHAATALLHGCAKFVSNDEKFKQVPGLPYVLLDALMATP